MLWSIKCSTAGEEEHADGDHAEELFLRNKWNLWLFIRRRAGKCDSRSCSEPDLRGELLPRAQVSL
jgi:hypothetical protein